MRSKRLAGQCSTPKKGRLSIPAGGGRAWAVAEVIAASVVVLVSTAAADASQGFTAGLTMDAAAVGGGDPPTRTPSASVPTAAGAMVERRSSSGRGVIVHGQHGTEIVMPNLQFIVQQHV